MNEDLLEPINSIIAFADVLLKDDVHPLSRIYSQVVNIIYKNGVRCNKLMLEQPQESVRHPAIELRIALAAIESGCLLNVGSP